MRIFAFMFIKEIGLEFLLHLYLVLVLGGYWLYEKTLEALLPLQFCDNNNYDNLAVSKEALVLVS